MRYQGLQLFLMGTIIFVHQQLEIYINLRRLWISPRSMFWSILIPLAVYSIGEIIRIKKKVDYEDSLANYYLCALFLWGD